MSGKFDQMISRLINKEIANLGQPSAWWAKLAGVNRLHNPDELILVDMDK